MGSALDFSCPECGYRVESMISGYSVGMETHAVGVSCADCKELYWAVLPGEPWKADIEALTAEVESGGLPAGARCPKSAKHRVTVWRSPGPCPRCGARLIPGRDLTCWD